MPAQQRRQSSGLIVVVVVLVLMAAHWVAAHPVFGAFILVVLATVMVVAGVLRFRGRLRWRVPRWRKPLAMHDPHYMNADEFEEFLAQLCRRDGCRNVQVVGGAGDLGADVLYIDPNGYRGVIQAKRFAVGNKVKSEHVQIVNGTYRDEHRGAHAAIVTTSDFTEPAARFAKKVGIACLDGRRLDMWARGYQHAAPWN